MSLPLQEGVIAMMAIARGRDSYDGHCKKTRKPLQEVIMAVAKKA